MGSKKKNNTAVKEEQDFAADILAEELQGVLKSVPDQNAHEFFNVLKDEMLEEGINLEKSIVQGASDQDFTQIDMIPEELKEQIEAEKKAKDSAVESGSFEPDLDDNLQGCEVSEVKTPEGLGDFLNPTELETADILGAAHPKESLKPEEPVEATAAAAVEVVTEEENAGGEMSKEDVEAAVDEIFGGAASQDLDEPTNAVRVFDDKTAAVQDFPETTAMSTDDKTQDLSSLENVTSMESAKAQVFHQAAKRNPSIDLKNADYIKFAQGKIKNLEKELSSLRIETQELALAGSHFKALADEREQRNKSLEAKISEVQSTSVEEKKILNAALEAKETKISLLQERVENLEVELESKYNRLRVRERELESRLEILKQEQDAVASSKDDLILRVKKQNNSLTADLERARAQSQKNSSLLQEKEDALRRTIKALKLSLTMLESQKQN